VPNAATVQQCPVGGRASPRAPNPGATGGILERTAVLACFVLGAVLGTPCPADASEVTLARARETEALLHAFPKRAQADLAELVARVDDESATGRRYVYALYGQAMAAAGRNAEALALAERLERQADGASDDLLLATARLVRATAEWLAGDAARANGLAKEARTLLGGASDPYLAYWAAATIGVTARSRGQIEEALDSLQGALSMAERDDNAFRQSSALYQLSNVYLAMRQPQNALQASLRAYVLAEAAGSASAMMNARMAESAAMELLGNPARELAAMTEALALAQKSQSRVGESLALINLADIRLRRGQFSDALTLSRRSLALAAEFNDSGSVATSKANIGFSLFGLGRAAEGKRYADEALASYERTGATAEIAALLGEYGQYLEQAGEFKAALALFHRERRFYEQMAAAAHQRSVLEMQEKYESERSRREIELLNRQNALSKAELDNQALRERVWWLLVAGFVISLTVIAVFYRKLRVNNGMLAQRNRELSVRSSRDPLTSLYNRRYFQDFMRDAPNQPERRRRGEAQSPIHALLLIDIDLFKQTNDRHGHAAGDAVLVAVARRLSETLRETDMIVRWGGEEFLVFVPATSAEKLDEIAARVMVAVASEPIVHQGRLIRVTASIGYAPMPLPPEDVALPWDRAIGLVDMALYMAKLHGRNCAYGIRRLRRSDDEAMERIERDLQSAWANGMVEMHLEPGPRIDCDVAETSWPPSVAPA
jgi:diguanylate cyclase (GGDEF)-like protein